VVLDAVGKSSFGRCRRLLRPKGLYLSTDLGPLSQNLALPLVTPLLGGRRVRFPIPRTPDRERVWRFQELLAAGACRPG
jgi:NADPH:quinone reductase-like Zn-dependent oxidoreductase